MQYRDDIEGLRAVAVILVLFFHLELAQVPGGFIGVDAFFVISGFLITGIIARDVEAGQFSFAGFYLRRLRRLGPALLFTLAVTMLAGWFLFPPEMYAQTGQSAIAALLAVSNIFFWNETGYFASEVIFHPLLHTWSLGVEEQFYLVWPALMLLLLPRLRRRGVMIAIGVLCVFSLGAAALFLSTHPAAVFYFTPFRAFELGIGALLALGGWQARNRIMADLASLLGLGLLLYLGNTLTQSDPFPGPGAVLPVLGAALMIWAGPQGVFNRAIALPPISYLGRISYSLYLIHWPLIVCYHFLYGRPETSTEIVLVAGLSIALGALMYHLVETPFRRRGAAGFAVSNRSLLRGSLLGVATVLLAAAGLHVSKGVPQRLPAEIRTLLTELPGQIDVRRARLRDQTCNGSTYLPVNYFTAFADCLPAADDGFIVVMGDSHGSGLYLGLTSVYPDLPFVQMTANSCDLTKSIESHPFCGPIFRFWQDWLAENAGRIAAVIYTQDGESLKSTVVGGFSRPDPRLIATLDANLTAMMPEGVPVIFWGPRPSLPTSIVMAVARSKSAEDLRHYYGRDDFGSDFALDARLTTHFADHRMRYVSSAGPLCAPDCPLLTEDGKLFVMDRAHWTPEGAIEAVGKVVESDPALAALLTR